MPLYNKVCESILMVFNFFILKRLEKVKNDPNAVDQLKKDVHEIVLINNIRYL